MVKNKLVIPFVKWVGGKRQLDCLNLELMIIAISLTHTHPPKASPI